MLTGTAQAALAFDDAADGLVLGQQLLLAPGIGLNLSVSNTDGYTSQKGEFTLTGLGSLSLTGKATQVAGGFNWEIKNTNGITVTYVAGAKSGTVKNADGTLLGTISSQRVSFIDNTYTSLI